MKASLEFASPDSDFGSNVNQTLCSLFMGTPEIAVPVLRVLAARTSCRGVVTQPDRPAGRGHQLQPPAVKVAALELGLPVWQPETLKGQAADPRLQGLDLIVVMAYGELLRQEVLDLPRLGCINLHASLLPRWRGASPLQAVIRAGDPATGVTVMRMVRGLDAGPIYLTQTVPLDGTTTLPWLHDALADAAATALGRFLDHPTAIPVEQDPALVTHCRKLLPEDGRLDWNLAQADLDRWVRAYTPAPGCWVPQGSDRIKILGLEPAGPADLTPGQTMVAGERILVGCGDGAVAVTRLQMPGRKPLAAAEFLRGARIPERL